MELVAGKPLHPPGGAARGSDTSPSGVNPAAAVGWGGQRPPVRRAAWESRGGGRSPPEDGLLKTGPVGFLHRLSRGAGNGSGDWAGPSELRTWTARFLPGPVTRDFVPPSMAVSKFKHLPFYVAHVDGLKELHRAVLLAFWISEAGG